MTKSRLSVSKVKAYMLNEWWRAANRACYCSELMKLSYSNLSRLVNRMVCFQNILAYVSVLAPLKIMLHDIWVTKPVVFLFHVLKIFQPILWHLLYETWWLYIYLYRVILLSIKLAHCQTAIWSSSLSSNPKI